MAGMNRLLDLPDELLLAVLHFILPADLEAFSQVSRKIYNFTKPLLPVHRAYIRRYTESVNDGGASVIPTLLTAIVKDRMIGHYIRHFDLTNILDDATSNRRHLDSSEFALLLCVVQETKLLEPQMQTKERLDEALKASDDDISGFFLPLLLNLLPNLKILSLSEDTHKSF